MSMPDHLPEQPKTERLLIRVARPGDVAAMHAAVNPSPAGRAGFRLQGVRLDERLGPPGRRRDTRIHARTPPSAAPP